MALPEKHSCSRDRALEMRMRDALDALEELACASVHASAAGMEGLEILSIEPPPPEDPLQGKNRAPVHRLPRRKTRESTSDIAEWLIRREGQA